MKKLFLIALAIGTLTSCSKDIEQSELIEKQEVFAKETDTFYKKAWYHSDGDLVMPINLHNPKKTYFSKFTVTDNRDVKDHTGAVVYTDPECTQRSSDYWYCGGGVYTNGNPAQNYTVAYYEGIWNVLMEAPWPYTVVYDAFADHVYAYTTRWGGVCP